MGRCPIINKKVDELVNFDSNTACHFVNKLTSPSTVRNTFDSNMVYRFVRILFLQVSDLSVEGLLQEPP